MDHDHFHRIQDDLREPYRALRDALPEVMSGYNAMHAAAFRDGALSAKTKELIALAISITRECDGCVAAHARRCAGRGATTEEVAEMIGVAISMNGGPGTVWGPRALAAFAEFSVTS
ncbi:MAG TPA: carboxymuconolactone decarboxylase family protein [Acidimicrobiales bacterium]|nr:carboxymuconolactone decarboxylase family protein [Acidimicrobiales bacterium]